MFVSPTSIVPTLVFWAVFLYWYRPSFASLPLRRSTHSSTKRIMTGSSETMGLLRVRFEVTCSWRICRAAWCCSTPMSSWARLLRHVSLCHLPWMRRAQRGAYSVFSGLECGGGAMLGSCGSRIQLLGSRGAYRAGRRRSKGSSCAGAQVFHGDDDVPVAGCKKIVG
jgi:hypothetical protein